MSDDEYDTHCPLCCEEMDLSDRNFLPCPCGYKVCMWCWHHIRENMNGLCPACRTPYNSDPHAFSAVDREDVVKLKKEKRQKEKQEKKTAERVVVSAPGAGVKSAASTVTDRRHLHNYRVVQRNLVYVIGVPANYASEENLRKPEFFGQYGKIGKVVIHRNHSSVHSTVSVYVTFVYKEDARASIQSLDGHWLDQNHLLRASFGTTKYCNNFIRGVPCNNPECVYLHDLGDDDDRFTKEEIQAGHSKIPPVPGKDQTLVTGGGGPSGTGKRPTGEPILPPPVFIQDNYPALGSSASSTSQAISAAPAGVSSTVNAPSAMMAAPGLSSTTASSSATATSVPLVPPGVPRPATVSRAGTGTWGGANTIAAITGSASLRSVSTEREREREIEREREDLSRDSHTNTPLHFPPLSSSVSSSNLHAQASQASTPAQATEETGRVPTAVLKRSASNTTNNAPVSLPSPPPVAEPTPTAVTTTTTTPATTTTTTAAAPAVPAVKTKPKTAKELAREAAAEKKAAAAAARAEKLALAAQASAAAAAATATTDASAAPPASQGDGESKSSTTTAPAIVPTPKLSAKQQMLANKAEKAAKAQAAALAAQEAREAARAAKENAKAAAREHALALHNGGMSKKDAKSAANAASTAAKSTDDASIVAHDSTLDLSILQQVAAPVTSMLESPPEYSLVPGFNGLSVNSLFPVPVSSLSCSVWSNILRASNEDLSINPYGVLEVPVSELLDLMLPPVDAMLSSAPCWPRPLAYYSQGMQAGGVTFSPAGKHIHQRSVHDMALLPPMLHLPSSVTQQQHQLHSRQQSREQEVLLSPAELAALAQRRSKVAALLQAISTESEEADVLPVAPALVMAGSAGAALGPPPGVGAPPGVGRPVNPPLAVLGAVRSNGRTAGPAHLPPPPGVTPVVASVASVVPSGAASGAAAGSGSASGNVGATNINALRQLFPGVKMSVSSSK